MKRFLRAVSAILVVGVAFGPLYMANQRGVDPQLVTTDKLVPLLAAFLVSTAFVTALYTSFSNDKRLRANSGKVLVALIFFATAILLLAVSLLVTAVGPAGAVTEAIPTIVYFGITLYFLTFAYLLIRVFLPTYNQVYNLRTNKLYKYFPPVVAVRGLFARDERYEMNDPVPRTNVDFGILRDCLSEEERTQLGRGGTVLLTGSSNHQTLRDVIALVEERLAAGETANYVCCDRHPYEVWSLWKAVSNSDAAAAARRLNDLVFIDGYSPSFAFTDDIQRENDRRLDIEGVSYVKARTFAGLHTSVNRAFHIIKAKAVKGGPRVRRAQTMVYAHTSALCDFESVEQFRVYWRHVIPSERSYGMVTIIIEDEHAGPDILGPLKQRADFVISYSRDANGTVSLSREK